MRFIRDIVRLHDRFLQIDSEKGMGSLISVVVVRTEEMRCKALSIQPDKLFNGKTYFD